MPVEIVQGKSLEEIRQTWAAKLNCSPEALNLEVLDKPGFLSKKWKVRITWEEAKEEPSQEPADEQATQVFVSDEPAANFETKIIRHDDRFELHIGEGVEMVAPHEYLGELKLDGVTKAKPFGVRSGDIVEFYPGENPGCRIWQVDIRSNGLSAVARVKNEQGIKYILPDSIFSSERLVLAAHVKQEKVAPWGEVWGKERFEGDLRQKGIVHGIIPDAWDHLMMIEGDKELIVAEATMPVPPVQPKLENYVGVEATDQNEGEKVDFFASKIRLIEAGDVLARKIPGIPGVPGKDVMGRVIPVAPIKDFKFKLKKNVSLSESELEVIATTSGHPVRLDEYSYLVENVYAVNSDVSLETGSVEFTGDVFIGGNVQDSMHVYAGGKVEVRGSVSHAEIRAEKGLKIIHNLLGGKIVVGQRFVVRSETLRRLSEFNSELQLCLQQTAVLVGSAAGTNIKPGQLLKVTIERQFPDLPKRVTEIETYLLKNPDELITDSLIVAVRTTKHFLSGLGPLDLQSLPFLTKASREFNQFVDNIALEVPEKLSCVIDYAQGATIECGGSFQCQKGVFNSTISVEGDVVIEGVCRGGKIYSAGNITIKELGGSGVSTTVVQMKGSNRLKVDYCHPNVMVMVDREIVQIEEACKKLEIYRERGVVQVEKLKA